MEIVALFGVLEIADCLFLYITHHWCMCGTKGSRTSCAILTGSFLVPTFIYIISSLLSFVRLTLLLVTCYFLFLYPTLILLGLILYCIYMFWGVFFWIFLYPPPQSVCSMRTVFCFVPYYILKILRSSCYLCSRYLNICRIDE